MNNLDPIATDVKTFMEKHSMSASTFGRMATGEPNLVLDLFKGREPRRKTRQRIRGFMAEYEQQVSA